MRNQSISKYFVLPFSRLEFIGGQVKVLWPVLPSGFIPEIYEGLASSCQQPSHYRYVHFWSDHTTSNKHAFSDDCIMPDITDVCLASIRGQKTSGNDRREPRSIREIYAYWQHSNGFNSDHFATEWDDQAKQ